MSKQSRAVVLAVLGAAAVRAVAAASVALLARAILNRRRSSR